MIKKKLLDLLSLLKPHAGGTTLEVPVVPSLLTPISPPPPAQTNLADKKQKKDKKGGKSSATEGGGDSR